MEVLFAFGLAAFAYSLLAAKLEAWWISAPLAMAAAGLLVSERGLGLINLNPERELVVLLAEITLVLVLFTDAARIDLRAAAEDPGPPIRLLGIGMPLTIALGALTALVLFDALDLWEAALLAVVLAPTDAALGQPVVTSPSVPVRVRRSLNIESGLNDGLAVPLVFLFIALIDETGDAGGPGFWTQFVAEQVGIGALVGIGAGFVGARALGWAIRSGVAGELWEGVAVIALPLIIFAGADVVGGNGFIAAFVGGLVFGELCGEERRESLLLFSEREGQLLELGIFFVFGLAFMPVVIADATWTAALYAVLSLTVLRMIPVAIATIGMGIRPATIAFTGWFGPRGLATLVLALLILEEPEVIDGEQIFAIAGLTVALSIAAHGLSATPLVARYSAWSDSLPSDADEMVPMDDDVPTRFGPAVVSLGRLTPRRSRRDDADG